jgi:hypothetical protein
MKIDLLLLPRGQNPLSYSRLLYNEYIYYSIMNLNTINILALVAKANKRAGLGKPITISLSPNMG